MQERSYSGKQFRPSPEIHIENDGSVGIIATPWGGRQGGKRVIETLLDFVLSSRNDMEATSPFQKMTCLSPLANTLRVAIMLANDSLFREENRNEYASGVELLVFAKYEDEIAWAQIGQPNLYLHRENVGLIPMGIQMDLATELSPSPNLAPLPSMLIGLNPTSNFAVNSFRPYAGDQLVFLSRSRTPTSLFALKSKKITMESMAEVLSQDSPDLPFWLGHYKIPMRRAA
jgi:hypothetical protein